MAVKDISDTLVCESVHLMRNEKFDWIYDGFPYDYLMVKTGKSLKECYRAMERSESRGYLEYGVSLRTAWLTEKGKRLIGVENGETTAQVIKDAL